MATQATAVFRFRTGGNAANGAGYDPGISGAGSDYSQQDAAQLTLSDVACSNTTTVTSVTGGFTSAMIGNAFRITGGGATTGYYWITAYTDTHTITTDRTPGTVTAGSGRVGGACTGDPMNVAAHVVAGNIVYLRATAGNATSYPTTSLDYAIGAFTTPTAGSASAGQVKWIGENGMPTIGSPGLGFYNCSYQTWDGLYFVATSSVNGTNGILNPNGECRVLNCILNMNNQSATRGIGSAKDGTVIINNEIYGGTASPTASATSDGISTSTYNVVIEGNRIHHCRDNGILAGTGVNIVNNRIWLCVGNGIEAPDTTVNVASAILGNTIDANKGHGINVSGTAGIPCYAIANNNITNHNQASKVGLRVTDGTQALNDRRVRFADYNNLYNNTTNYSGISAGTHDLAVDPTYASASTGDFTPSNTATQVGL